MPITEVCAGVRYEVVGEPERPLVLIHGLGGSRHWWRNVASLLTHRRCVLIDVPGFGESELAKGCFTVSSMVDPIERLLDHLQLGRADIAGHSFGALLATELAARDRAHTLNLVSGTLFSALEVVRSPRAALHRPALAAALAAQLVASTIPGRSRLVRGATSTSVGRRTALWPFVARPAGTDVASVLDGLAGNVGGSAAFRLLPVLADWQLAATACEVRCPVRLLWGSEDRLIDESDIALARALMSVEQFRCLPGVGHWPNIEAPMETADFLS